MVKLEDFLYQTTKEIMSGWDEEDIYAVSFFVYSNEMFCFRGYDNVSTFAISYNTESDCDNAGPHAEERWNYAFWRQDEWHLIEPDENSLGMQLLFDWYQEQGITNIGYEGAGTPDGPVGFPELVRLVADVARKIQEEGFLKEKFSRPIPILIHDLEYCDCTIKATEYANPHGEAADFLYGNWETESAPVPLAAESALSVARNFAEELSRNPEKMAQFYANSPGLSKEFIDEMMKKVLNS
jgi:hypothetical protein